jgi:Ran GTPase-activating protein (RanGAP) involved in mRNA processing and transport
MLKAEWLATTIARLEQNDPTLTSIERICSQHNDALLNTADAIALADALYGNTNVTTINIHDSNILDEGGVAIVYALMDNRSVTTLNLRNNGFVDAASMPWNTATAVTAITELLKVTKTLTTLNLSDNALFPTSIVALSEGLKVNTSVTTLHLDFVTMGGNGVIALGEALELNRTLKHLSMDGNCFSPAAANTFIMSLEKNHSLTTLQADDCHHRACHIANLMARNQKVAWVSTLICRQSTLMLGFRLLRS